MSLKHLTGFLVLTLTLGLAGLGCTVEADDDDDNDAGDTETEDTETEETETEDTESASDTGPEPAVCDGTHDWDPDDYDYGPDYAEGPFGFKGSMCWDMNAGTGEWTTFGDTLHDICLPNQDDVEICLHDYYKSDEYDLVFYDVSAYWCPPCRLAAQSEKEFVEYLAENGWRVLWITILEENNDGGPPTRENASDWRTNYALEGDVLYDPDQVWLDRIMLDKWTQDERGYPTIFMTHTSNMLIWDFVAGWADPAVTADWNAFKAWFVSFFSEVETAEGAIDVDTDEDTDSETAGTDTNPGTDDTGSEVDTGSEADTADTGSEADTTDTGSEVDTGSDSATV